jgi:aspartate/methionine/tyrosine aminotransferase
VTALSLGASYDDRLKADYIARRNLLCNGLEQAGFTFVRPRGGYFVLANYSALDSRSDDKEFAHRLLAEAGVAGVPGSYFFSSSGSTQLLRFAFCKKLDTLQEAVGRLLSWNSREKRQ